MKHLITTLILLQMVVLGNAVQVPTRLKTAITEACGDFVKGENIASLPATIQTYQVPNICSQHMPDPEDYTQLQFLIWDPMTQLPDLCNSKVLFCPRCVCRGNKNPLQKTAKWYNGEYKKMPTRILYHVTGQVILVSRAYICTKKHYVPAHDRPIINLIPEIHVPFVLFHRSGVTKEIVSKICHLMNVGMKVEEVQKSILTDLIEKHYKNEIMFWSDCSRASNMRKLKTNDVGIFPKFNKCHLISRNLIKFIYIHTTNLRIPLMLSTVIERCGEWLTCDHTFKVAANIGTRTHDGKWKRFYKSLICVLNENGEVLKWLFTKGQSFNEVKQMFVEIANRFTKHKKFLKGIVIDNCCAWKNQLTQMFPYLSEQNVKLDIFHAVHRLTSKISKKEQLYGQMCRDYSKVFRNLGDDGKYRSMKTPSPSKLIFNLQNFEKKYEPSGLLTGKVKQQLKNIRKHILKGCLSYIPVGIGTNRNERLHRSLKKTVASQRMGVPLALAKLMHFFYYWNEKRDSSSQERSIEERVAMHMKEKCLNHLDSQNLDRQVEECKMEEVLFGTKVMHESNTFKISPITFDVMLNTLEQVNHCMKSSMFEHSYTPHPRSSKCLEILQAGFYFWLVLEVCKLSVSNVNISPRMGDKYGHDRIKSTIEGITGQQCSDQGIVEDTNVPSLHEDVLNIKLQRLNLERIPILGDGNCFFYAVAYQVCRMLDKKDCSLKIVSHLEDLGILPGMEMIPVSEMLRKSIVDEWTHNSEVYENFFPGLDIKTDSKYYADNGVFSGALGDAMPLGMANLLQVPIVLVHSVHNMDTQCVVPSTICDKTKNMEIIYLAYNSSGPGHYDAIRKLGERITVSESPVFSDETINTKNNGEQSPNEKGCRCGHNVDLKVFPSHTSCCPPSPNTSGKKYKSRCPCFKSNNPCRRSCKCKSCANPSGCNKLTPTKAVQKRSCAKQIKFKTQNMLSQFDVPKLKQSDSQLVQQLVSCVWHVLFHAFPDKTKSENSMFFLHWFNDLVNVMEEHRFLIRFEVPDKRGVDKLLRKIKTQM